MSIILGWWILPLLVTIGSFGWAFNFTSQGDYDPGPTLAFFFAFIPTLAAWLVWALLN